MKKTWSILKGILIFQHWTSEVMKTEIENNWEARSWLTKGDYFYRINIVFIALYQETQQLTMSWLLFKSIAKTKYRVHKHKKIKGILLSLKNEILPSVIAWMKLEDNYAKWNKSMTKGKYCMIPLVWDVKCSQTESRKGVTGGRERAVLSWVHSFSYSRWINSRDLKYNMVPVANNESNT